VHLRPRSQSEIPPSAGSNTPPIGTVTPVDDPKDAHILNDKATRPPPLSEASPQDSTPTPDQLLSLQLPCSKRQIDLKPAGAVVTSK